MSGYIGTTPVPQATQHREAFTANANQTTFATAGYTVGYIDVWVNGVKLAAADVTVTNGSDIVLASAAAANDIVEYLAFVPFEAVNQTFTGATVINSLNINSDGATVTGIKDEDNMASNDANKLATQQSIKAYVDSTVAATNEVVEDTTPQLGGDLASNGNDILMADSDKVILGTGSDLQIYHDGSYSRIMESGGTALVLDTTSTDIRLTADNSEVMGKFVKNGAVELYHNSSKKLETTSAGINVTGSVTADGLTVDGGGSRQYINSGHLRLSDDYNLEWGGGTNYIRGNNSSGAMSLISTGNLTLDAAGDIILDADGGDVLLKDGGTQFGSVGNNGTYIYVGSHGSSGKGIKITDALLPATNAGAFNDADVNLGASNVRWKDLYLSGTAYVGAGMQVAGHPVVGYASFDSGYATRLGSTGSSTLNATQIYAGGSVQATFKGLKAGFGTTTPKRHIHLNGGNETTKIQITNQTTGSSSDGDGFQIGIATDGTANIEQRENADLVFTTNNTERMRMDSSGAVTMPSQPAFSVHKNGTDQSNIALNTDVTLTWTHSRFDQNSDFDFVNGRFTAPVTGKYQLNGNILLESLDAAAAYYIVYLHTSNAKYRFIFDPDFMSDSPYWSVAISVIADMDANDISSIVVNQGGGTSQTDIEGSAEYTNFSGYLVA